jgi:GTP-binding protein Era
MTEPRRTPSSSQPRKPAASQAARNAARNSRARKAEEVEESERRKRQSIAKAERRTTSEQVRSAEPAPTAAGRAPEGTGAATPSYLDIPEGYRAGFACFVGRPNAGKSTLTNALVGAKIAITSGKPQTTRHTVRGIVHRPDAQLVLVDTPGLHRPRTLLGERLNEQVRATWAEVDVIGFCIPANQEIGPGDRYIAQQLAQVRRTPKVAIVTKTDTMGKQAVGEQLLAVLELGKEIGIEWAEIIPVSAITDSQVGLLADLLVQQLPLSPPLYPGGELTDEPEQVMVGELIREAALEGVRDELPHSLAVTVEEMLPRTDRPKDKPLLDVHATLYVERSSQKSIVIGTGGSRLREVGTRARQQIEALLGTPVFLDLHVKVAKDWQRDPKQLQRLGF